MENSCSSGSPMRPAGSRNSSLNFRPRRPSRSKRPGRGGGWSIFSSNSAIVRCSRIKQTKAIAAARLKNDRVDAERLALLLRGDLLPTVWIPPAALREARELVRHRIQLVWLRGVVRNRLQAMLARRNLQPTSGKSWLTQRGQRELKGLPLPDAPSRIREDCAALLPTLDAQSRRLDADLVTRWGADPRVRRLTTIPGIGPFIAIVLVL